MSNTYRLINPYIEGNVDTIVRAKDSYNAGKKLYKNISKHFTNSVDSFNMSAQNIDTKKLTHYAIHEKMGKDGGIDYDITRLSGNFPKASENNLVKSVDKIEKQSGGKKHHRRRDDSSSTSSSSDSDYLHFNIPYSPITNFVYYSLPYYKLYVTDTSPIITTNFSLPTFSFPINPSYQVNLDFANISITI
jgi:hypothetical protein